MKYHNQNTTLKYFLRIPEDKFDVMFFLITVGRNALTDGVPDPPHGASGLQSRLQTFSLGRWPLPRLPEGPRGNHSRVNGFWKFWKALVLSVGPFNLCFAFRVTGVLGFKATVELLPFYLHVMDSSESLWVQHLLTFWHPLSTNWKLRTLHRDRHRYK